MMKPSQLRAAHIEQGAYCRWPCCHDSRNLQLAHLEQRGMGGGPAMNTMANVAILCRYHHDVLDGRTVLNRPTAIHRLLDAWGPQATGITCEFPECVTRRETPNQPWCAAHAQWVRSMVMPGSVVPNSRRDLRALLKGVLHAEH
jgi:hypothetical protein